MTNKTLTLKRTLYIIAFLVFPIFAMGQENTEVSKVEINSALKTEITIKKVDPISANPLKQTKVLNTIKSDELISVNAYIKTLKLKRKKTVLS